MSAVQPLDESTHGAGSAGVSDRIALALRGRLDGLTLRDARRIGRRLDGLRRDRDPGRRERVLADLTRQVEAGEVLLAARAASVPRVSYPADLPVSARRDDLAAAIGAHQVVVVAGETGSGKTTQLPKICLELGRGVRGSIGHTQPRRIAARAVAERVAEELGVTLGAQVGYAVRFTDRTSESTLLTVLTDGLLLAEIQRDPDLLRYDTLIVDEAHERSLTIDFLLGYLTQLLPRRPDLKLIITSATIEPGRFAAHFGGAPVVEVSGRTYPVELRYRPYEGTDEPGADGDGGAPGSAADGQVTDQPSAIRAAVAELGREGPGDVLVFLSGEREIRDAAEALEDIDAEVLPLFGRLSAADQHRVFAAHTGRRVVLATNVAETSLTVPGIRYVVDTGLARISRYSARTKVQRLPVEPISRASADQRAGRCGRVADGICIRLYSEPDLLARSEFTDPEVLRTGLASVVLQMAALRLGDIASFPFLDPPDRRQVRDAVALLAELGALEGGADPSVRLTGIGRQLARLPVDPRVGRMILAADRDGCLPEMLVLAAALSVLDVRERPTDQQAEATGAHARFADPRSDAGAPLRLWAYLGERQKSLSSSAFRRMCRREFINHQRVREWQDLHAQLRRVARDLGLEADGFALPAVDGAPGELSQERLDLVHQAMLTGLLSQVGLRDPEKRDYLGARGTRFVVARDSVLAKKGPRWVLAAELVETNRLWARMVAPVDPLWLERAGSHVVARSYSDPRWDRRRAAAVVTERVTLYGLPLVTGRTVSFARVDEPGARELFLRHALIGGEWDGRHAFLAHNDRALREALGLEERSRRRDLVLGDDALFDVYDERVPADVVSGRHFESWWRGARRSTPNLLDVSPADLLGPQAASVRLEDFPDTWRQNDLELRLRYRFEPGAEDDGVTVEVPLLVLGRVLAADLDWQVPGMREALATALVRGLPKALRRSLVPAPDVARMALGELDARHGLLTEALAAQLSRLGGVQVTGADLDLPRLEPWLRPRYEVREEGGRVLGAGRDLDALRAQLAGQLRGALGRAAPELARAGLTEWPAELERLPRQVAAPGGGVGYPALVDEGDTVAVRVLASAAEQAAAMPAGTRRLLTLSLPSPARWVSDRIGVRATLALAQGPHGSLRALLADCAAAALDQLITQNGGSAWDAEAFGLLRDAVRTDYADAVLEVVRAVEPVLAAAGRVRGRLEEVRRPAVRSDIVEQVDGLVHAGFVAEVGRERLADLLRYLRGAELRLDGLTRDPDRDERRLRAVTEVAAAVRAAGTRHPGDAAGELRWMVEELRISLFAQAIGTPGPVSEVRIRRAIADLDGAR